MRFLKFFGVAIMFWAIQLGAQSVQIGSGYITGTIGGPYSASTLRDTQFSRFAYIFPKSVLGNITHGDTIVSTEFYRVAGAIPDSNASITFWFGNTNRSDFGSGKISFAGEIGKATLAIQTKPSIIFGPEEKFYPIQFLKGYRYDSLKGENLTMFVEFKQWKKPKNGITFYLENSNSVVGYANNQTKYYAGGSNIDSLPSSTSYHPTLIFNFPKFNQDIDIQKVYTLGKIPLPLGKPDSVQVLVKNVGKKPLKQFTIYTRSKGANIEKDSFKVSLNYGESKIVTVPSLNPLKNGLDTVFVESKDINNYNNSAFSYRLGNPNVYSYRDVTESPEPGGIGFNGTNGDFVARFYSAGAKYINQVTVTFGGSGDPFKVGIWEFNKKTRMPGKLIFQSDSLTSKAGNYILDLKNPVLINGSFFVGVRQLDVNNVAFGYQMEDPVRPNTFYYAEPLGDTNWVDFHPDAPFKFLIEPRLQADYDFSAIAAISPKDSLNIYKNDTIAPTATFGNVGVLSPKDSCTFHCEIYGPNGSKIYGEIKKDTLSSGIKRTYTFPKTFIPKQFGEHKLLFYCRYSRDSILDNDTQQLKFYVGVKQDVAITTVYDPVNFNRYEYQVDTLMPLATVTNIGYDAVSTFAVRCKMMKGSKVIYNQSQSLSLPKFQSKILYWNTTKFSDTGNINVYFITEYSKDANRKNDTATRSIRVFKLLDVGIDSIQNPKANSYYDLGSSITFQYGLFNDGAIKAWQVPIRCKVYDPSGKLVFNDSVKYDVEMYTRYNVNWLKKFTPKSKGIFKLIIGASDPLDKFKYNDSLIRLFVIGRPYDIALKSIINPINKDTFKVGYGVFTPEITIQNNGLNKSSFPLSVEIFYEGFKVHYEIINKTMDTGITENFKYPTSFSPPYTGKYSIQFVGNLTGDVYRLNDTLRATFYAEIGKDVYPHNIIADGGKSLFDVRDTLRTVQVKFTNQGTDSMKNIPFVVQGYLDGDFLFEQKNNVSLASGQTDSVTFYVNSSFWRTGTLLIRSFTRSSTDQNHKNDTAFEFFDVQYLRDFKLLALKNPGVSNTPDTTTLWKPEVWCTNVGSSDSTVGAALHYVVKNLENNKDILHQIKPLAAIAKGDTVKVKFDSMRIEHAGCYLISSFVGNKIDGNNSNDTLLLLYCVKNNLVSKLDVFSIVIQPNPADNWFEIHHPLSSPFEWKLLDIQGKRITSGNEKNVTILTENLSNGVYFITINTEQGLISRKIIIQH